MRWDTLFEDLTFGHFVIICALLIVVICFNPINLASGWAILVIVVIVLYVFVWVYKRVMEGING